MVEPVRINSPFPEVLMIETPVTGQYESEDSNLMLTSVKKSKDVSNSEYGSMIIGISSGPTHSTVSRLHPKGENSRSSYEKETYDCSEKAGWPTLLIGVIVIAREALGLFFKMSSSIILFVWKVAGEIDPDNWNSKLQ
jgi:hypothetical protein